ncbi:hypothetical protein POM88_025928 [Heracleum sosnowskyi]|uniref:Uncharacterized protein n=1 Tax=Heracleum sosnowskyi TaxID=360622 RepID=A0AAD8I655_9APIA|nr:hypothetical protein POM88_025928 [Heracleum sosnowskyi]
MENRSKEGFKRNLVVDRIRWMLFLSFLKQMEMPFRSSLPCLFLSDPGGSSAQVSLLILLCGLAIKGPDFRNKSPDELKAIVPYIQVMARSLPLDKHKLVTNLRSMYKEVVAVTGDGTNDAPALHEADIGLATGCFVEKHSRSKYLPNGPSVRVQFCREANSGTERFRCYHNSQYLHI